MGPFYRMVAAKPFAQRKTPRPVCTVRGFTQSDFQGRGLKAKLEPIARRDKRWLKKWPVSVEASGGDLGGRAKISGRHETAAKRGFLDQSSSEGGRESAGGSSGNSP
jgi:hypothetical protein